jgi:hypothetical protein
MSSSNSSRAAILRDLYLPAHEVSAALVALDEKHAACICAAEPLRMQEAECEARAEAAQRGARQGGPGRTQEGD